MLTYAIFKKTSLFIMLNVCIFSLAGCGEEEGGIKTLTNQILDAVLKNKGTYYLPYRLHISREKMRLAYPQADAFFRLKKKYDADEIFSNQFYVHYQ